MKHFLTIIVPVYNVADCVQRCLESIAKQTYADFECLVIDDGSPDNSGVLCDEFAKNDPRFRVIHQENKGLSGARNTALAMAKGDLVAFVDSDDWVEPTMYERMITLLDENNADIVMCDYLSERGNMQALSETGIQIYTGHEFTEKILKDEYGSQLWKFLYKASLWTGIVSPERRHAQDMMILHKVTDRAKTVVVTGEKLYGYNDVRENNISNSKKNFVKNKIDRALAFFCRMDFCCEHGYADIVKASVLKQAVLFAITAFSDISVKEKRFASDVETLQIYFKKYRADMKKYEVRKRDRARCRCLCVIPFTYARLYSMASKVIKK